MKKQSRMCRAAALFIACVLAIFLSVSVFAAGIPDPPQSYVLDEADVISDSTERYINEKNNSLAEACGAQIVFVAVDFTGNYSTHDYAYELFNQWGIGDKKANNGMLYVLVIGAEDYYALPGSGVLDVLSGGALDNILMDYMEPDFAAGDYDAAVRATFDRTLDILERKYGVETKTDAGVIMDTGYTGYEEARGQRSGLVSGLFRLLGKVLTFIVIMLVLRAILKMFSGPRGGGGSGGGGGFFSGWLLGSMMNRRRYYYRPPPPRPPYGGPRPPRPNPPGGMGGFGGHHGSGFGGNRPGGGFGGGRSGSFGGGRSGGGSRSGSFGGGRSRGGGAGRR